MEELTIAHSVLLITTNFIAIAVFFGLAVYVATYSPRRLISWVFSILCLTIATIYLSSFFLVSRAEAFPTTLSFLLRCQWLAITLAPTLFLHLIFFYFPPPWQQYRLQILLPAYLASGSLGLAVLFTDLLIAGPLYRPAPHIIGPMPGPLMPLLAGFSILQVAGSIIGLVASYRISHSLSLRYQIVNLITPSGLVLLSGVVHWINILTQDTGQIPHELPDALLILAAFFYASAVVRYGSFIGRPLTRRRLFYAIFTAIAGLITLYITLSLDTQLMTYTRFPYPLTTGIMVLAMATGFPAISRRVTRQLDRWFFQAERQQQMLIYHLADALAGVPDLEQLQSDLLQALCLVLDVRAGYIALPASGLPPGTLIVQAVQGNLGVQPGSRIRRPPLPGPEGEPQLVTTLLTQSQLAPGWQEVALFCPLTIDQNLDGILALGEKRDGTPFSPQEVALCAELARQLDPIGRMIRLHRHRRHYTQAAQLQDQALRQIGQEVTAAPSQSLAACAPQPAPVAIRVLGPLQLYLNGQLVAEAAWGSEKAKALLAYLLWKSPNGATREELAQALWPERPFEDTANVFHVTLHRLRRVLQPKAQEHVSSYIQHDRGRYRFSTDAPHWLDVTAFQTLVGQRNDLQALQAAVELYRGTYLEDMSWALPCEVEAQQRHFEQLYADALRQLAAHTTSREATLYLEKLLVIEPADEVAHRALVLSYLARGRRDLAGRQVARWQQALAELELAPSPEAKALWQRVKAKNGQQP